MNLLWIIFLVLIGGLTIGYVPLSFVSDYIQRRRDPMRPKRDLSDRMHLPLNIFEDPPQPSWDLVSFILPIGYATAAVTLGIFLAYPAVAGILYAAGIQLGGMPKNLVEPLQSVSRPLFFGFLGSYIFVVTTLQRRLNAGDLNPQAYIQVGGRVVVSLIVAGIVAMTFPRVGVDIASMENDPAHIFTLALVFVIGIFPEDGLRWLQNLATNLLRTAAKPVGGDALMMDPASYQELPLTTILGMNRWHAFRLGIEGIDNVNNLANADLQVLRRNTRYSTQQLFDWVDQAILLSAVGRAPVDVPWLPQVRRYSDFVISYRDPDGLNALLDTVKPEERDAERRRLKLLSLTLEEAPNAEAVRLYKLFEAGRLSGSLEHFYAAQVYLNDEMYERAMEELQKAIAANRTDPRMYVALGRAALQAWLNGYYTGDPDKTLLERAIAALTDALTLRSNYTEALFVRAQARRWLGQYVGALQDYEQILAFDAGSQDAQRGRALVYLLDQQGPKARADLQAVLQAHPQDVEALVLRGRLLLESGELAQAAEDLTFATTINDQQAEPFFWRGELHYRGGRYADAAADLQRALELSYPDKVLVQAHLAWSLFQLGQGDPVSLLDQAVSHNPAHFEAHVLRGLVLRQRTVATAGQAAEPSLTDLQIAVNDFTTAIRNRPLIPNWLYLTALVNRGIALTGLKRLREAETDLTEAIKIGKGNAALYAQVIAPPQALVEALLQRAQVYHERGMNSVALTDLDKAIESATAPAGGDMPAETSSLLVRTYLQRGTLRLALARESADDHLAQQAVDDAEAALPLDQQNVDATNLKALALWQMGRRTLALTLFDTAVELNAEYPITYLNRGEANAALGRIEQALADYIEAVRLCQGEFARYYAKAVLGLAALFLDPRVADAARVRQILEEGLGREPNNPDLLLAMGRLLNSNGDREGALAYIDQALKQQPGNIQALLLEGDLLRQTGNFEQAEKIFNQVIATPNATCEGYRHRGLLYAYRAYLEQQVAQKRSLAQLAMKDMDRAIELKCEPLGETYRERAHIRATLGDLPGAGRDLNQARSLGSVQEDDLQKLARWQSIQGNGAVSQPEAQKTM
ncbi:MAG: tetratricopeptide repeat protein [Chloroflexi bacterium]|nr:tetratricopeptide repeat protein [Chloroflexota bacterium]